MKILQNSLKFGSKFPKEPKMFPKIILLSLVETLSSPGPQGGCRAGYQRQRDENCCKNEYINFTSCCHMAGDMEAEDHCEMILIG